MWATERGNSQHRDSEGEKGCPSVSRNQEGGKQLEQKQQRRGEAQSWEGVGADLTGGGPPRAPGPLLWDRREPPQGLRQRHDVSGPSLLKHTLVAG